MRRILFILHHPPPIHGSSMVGLDIMESKIINSTYDSRYINLGTSIQLDEIGKGGWKKIRRYFNILSKTINHVTLFKPDLVYIALTAYGIGFYKDAIVAIITRVSGKKVVYHMHNRGVNKRQDIWFDNLLYKIVFRNADVIMSSKHLYYEIKKYVPKERVYFCYNGITNKKVNGILPSIRGDKDKVQILFLSNLLVTKGIFVLLEACQILQSKQLQFQCIYVGGEADISAEQFQEKVNEFSVNNSVHYVGPKYGLEKEKAFLHADIFVFPTYNENFGLVNVEAMQYALPVISTIEGGIPDVVEDGETGFLVKPLDAEALADKLEILINDPELRILMGKNGRSRYEEYFTKEVFEKRLTSILKELV